MIRVADRKMMGLACYHREAPANRLAPYKRYIAERVKAAASERISDDGAAAELRGLRYPSDTTFKDHRAGRRAGPTVSRVDAATKPEPVISRPGQAAPDALRLRNYPARARSAGGVHRVAGLGLPSSS
jgi:hypothetical protein